MSKEKVNEIRRNVASDVKEIMAGTIAQTKQFLTDNNVTEKEFADALGIDEASLKSLFNSNEETEFDIDIYTFLLIHALIGNAIAIVPQDDKKVKQQIHATRQLDDDIIPDRDEDGENEDGDDDFIPDEDENDGKLAFKTTGELRDMIINHVWESELDSPVETMSRQELVDFILSKELVKTPKQEKTEEIEPKDILSMTKALAKIIKENPSLSKMIQEIRL
jgi:hypothetical protein